MSPLTLNRVLFVLGVLGLFIAGVLSGEHLFHFEIPCTTGGGCLTVAKHEKSYLFGIPVAFFGFFGYLLLTALALVRLYTGDLLNKLFVGLGYFGAAIGMIASLYLQYVSFFEIHATCIWCLSSAINMVATFILYTILFGKVGSVEIDPASMTRSPKVLFQGAAAVLLASAAVAGVLVLLSRKEGGTVELVTNVNAESMLVPEPLSERNQLGPNDAPVTIVEFADLCCPTCRRSFNKIHEIMQKYPGKVRIIYRHFPIDQLRGHEMSLPAIMAAELAAQKGKFWDFAAAFTAPDEAPTTRDGLDRIASQVGVTSEDIDKALSDPNSIPQKHMLRDFSDARKGFDVEGTPTYVLKIKGQPLEKITLVKLMDELEKPETKKIMGL